MLRNYEEKRDFSRSPEPPPIKRAGAGPLTFVVHKHDARRLHYDLRLEVDGALKSWAVPQGPSADPEERRLAVMVEDHPLDYGSFEGVIPAGEYGAGEVIVWDSGTYSPEHAGNLYFEDRTGGEKLMQEGIGKGKISFYLRGEKLKGSWTLVKLARGDKDWLLIKHRDEFAGKADVLKDERSVLSGLTIADLKAGRLPGESSPVRLDNLPGVRRAPLPDTLAPMLASLTPEPFSDPDWLFEPKLDGFRSIAIIKGAARMLSRRGLDITANFREIADSLKRQPAAELVLDGEIVAIDETGRPCFQCLQNHLGMNVEPAALHGHGPVSIVYYVFDILYLDGFDLLNVPLIERKGVLSRVLKPEDLVRAIDYFEKEGQLVYEGAIRQGLEGTIAKRKDSTYEPGRRSHSWLKVKATRSEDFVIGGYNQGAGSRAHSFGSLLLGYYDDRGRLIYAGNVGSGFSDEDLEHLTRRLSELKTDTMPFAEKPPLTSPTTWVRPELVAEIKFAQWTHGGYLRAPVFLHLRQDKPPQEARPGEVVAAPRKSAGGQSGGPPQNEVESVLKQLEDPAEELDLKVDGHRIGLTNLNKEFWPAIEGRRALTKRDLLVYFARVSPWLLPHLKDRPLTLKRFPDGIYGEHFYQKHWEHKVPGFVRTVPITEEESGRRDYMLCNNLAALMWLGQIADIELHTWFSRISPEPDMLDDPRAIASVEEAADYLADYPDFLIFDIDPYIYSGKEGRGEEPELNRRAFARTVEVARWLKEVLDSLKLSAFIKTSGKTGLHIFVPMRRRLDYGTVRSAAGTVADYLLRQHPKEVTTEWSVEKRRGKIFIDHNQNVRGKTLASVYSPRVSPEASVSTPLRWDELEKVYPTDFTMFNIPERLAVAGDLWAGILDAKRDLQGAVRVAKEK